MSANGAFVQSLNRAFVQSQNGARGGEVGVVVLSSQAYLISIGMDTFDTQPPRAVWARGDSLSLQSQQTVVGVGAGSGPGFSQEFWVPAVNDSGQFVGAYQKDDSYWVDSLGAQIWNIVLDPLPNWYAARILWGAALDPPAPVRNSILRSYATDTGAAIATYPIDYTWAGGGDEQSIEVLAVESFKLPGGNEGVRVLCQERRTFDNSPDPDTFGLRTTIRRLDNSVELVIEEHDPYDSATDSRYLSMQRGESQTSVWHHALLWQAHPAGPAVQTFTHREVTSIGGVGAVVAGESQIDASLATQVRGTIRYPDGLSIVTLDDGADANVTGIAPSTFFESNLWPEPFGQGSTDGAIVRVPYPGEFLPIPAPAITLNWQPLLDKSMTTRPTQVSAVDFVLTRPADAPYIDDQGDPQTAGPDVPRFDHYPDSPFPSRGLVMQPNARSELNYTLSPHPWWEGLDGTFYLEIEVEPFVASQGKFFMYFAVSNQNYMSISHFSDGNVRASIVSGGGGLHANSTVDMQGGGIFRIAFAFDDIPDVAYFYANGVRSTDFTTVNAPGLANARCEIGGTRASAFQGTVWVRDFRFYDSIGSEQFTDNLSQGLIPPPP